MQRRMHEPTPLLRPGDVCDGRYRVESLLGQGGFGAVYAAVQQNLGRRVALKVLRPHLSESGDFRARFDREAQIAQRLEHPNTVRILDFGRTQGGLPFIVWEYLDGRPLSEVLAREGPLSPARVARIALQVLGSLADAHRLGIVHRDVKPANLYLCQFAGEPDFVKVLDFGIAKLLDGGAAAMTQTGVVVGTPAYTSPEQALGTAVGPASDLYSLGLVMAELLAGHVIVTGRTQMEVFMRHASSQPVDLPPVVHSSGLGAVIARAVDKREGHRFREAREMADAIQSVLPTLDPTTRARGGGVAAAAPSPYAGPSHAPAVSPAGFGAGGAHAPLGAPAVPGTSRGQSATWTVAIVGAVLVTLALGGIGIYAAHEGGLLSLGSDRGRARDDDDRARPRKGAKAKASAGDDDEGGEDDAEPGDDLDGDDESGIILEDLEFAHLSDKEIEKRIEAAGFRVEKKQRIMITTNWHLEEESVPVGLVSRMAYTDDISPMIELEIAVDFPAVTAKDGSQILRVMIYEDMKESEQLMRKITR